MNNINIASINMVGAFFMLENGRNVYEYFKIIF